MPSYQNGQYSLGYVDPTDAGNKGLTQMMDFFYQSNYPGNSAVWVQGAIDSRFKAGDQSIYNPMMGFGNNTLNLPQKFFFNLVRRHINMICGFQRKNRKSTLTLPNRPGDDPLSDDYNKTMRWSEDRDGFQEYLSESFEGAATTGMNLLHLYPDYTYDPISGDLFTDNVAYNNFLIDQSFRKQDLSDCRGIWRRRWVNKQGAKALLPGFAKEIDKMRPGGITDGRFPMQFELMNVNTSDQFTYDEFYYRTTREGTLVLDPVTGESVEWEEMEDDEEGLMARVLAQQPWLMSYKSQIPTVKLIIALNGKIVYHGKTLLNTDDYPFVPTICYYEPDMKSYAWRVQGVVRNLRDAQFLYNMRKVIELQILQSQVNAGFIFPIDAVTDIKALRQSGDGGFLIPLKPGHLPNEIERIQPAAIPESLMALSQSLAEDITKISGVNEELLGAATDDKSGILSMLRQGAGLTTLQTIFDRLDYTQRLYGKLRLAAIRKNFSKGKIRNILGHDPDPRFFSTHAQKYCITVEEGNYSATQRQTELQQLLQFRELGVPISNQSIIRAGIITNKQQIIEEMQQEQQGQMQMQQMQAQQQQKLDNSKIMLEYTKSRAELAKEKELMASAQEKYANIDNVQADAERKNMESDLTLVKMMVELEDMQFNQFRSAFEHAQMIKAANQPQTTTAG